VITRGDDYPIHQTARPVAFPANPTDRNHYERFFFDGYTRDGDWFFAVAAAVYPNRGIMDAAVSIVHDGVQTNVRGSRRMPADFLDIDVGPISIKILEPLRRLAISVSPNESGLQAEVEFVARGPAVQEGPYTSSLGPLALQHYMRFTQQGGYRGSVAVGGRSVELSPESAWGCRDRSWGSRPVGDSDPTWGAQVMRMAQIYPPRAQRSQLLFLWAPLNFEDKILLWTTSRGIADPYDSAILAPADPGADYSHTTAIGHELKLRDKSNHIASASLQFETSDGKHEVSLEPLYDFSMSGIGYGHPEWGHGVWKGELEVGHDSFRSAEVNRTERQHMHVQTLCRATLDGKDEGIGVLEQIMGAYEPRPLS
jgi:hypothetical protein